MRDDGCEQPERAIETVIVGPPTLRDALEGGDVVPVDSSAARAGLVMLEHTRDLASVRRLREQRPELPVVVVVDAGTESPRLAVEAAEIGASGLLAADASSTDITTALRAVTRGGIYATGSSAQLLLGGVRARVQVSGHVALTPRERDVLAELVTGRTTREIATLLRVSQTTVQTHLKSLYRKLDVSSRAAATAVALRRRLV